MTAPSKEAPVWMNSDAAYGYECGYSAGYDAANTPAMTTPSDALAEAVIEAARDLVEAHVKIRTDTYERLDALIDALSRYDAERATGAVSNTDTVRVTDE